MAAETALNPTRLVIAAIIGLILLLVLIIKFKIQAMIAILIGAIAIGLLAGMPAADIVNAVNSGQSWKYPAAPRPLLLPW